MAPPCAQNPPQLKAPMAATKRHVQRRRTAGDKGSAVCVSVWVSHMVRPCAESPGQLKAPIATAIMQIRRNKSSAVCGSR